MEVDMIGIHVVSVFQHHQGNNMMVVAFAPSLRLTRTFAGTLDKIIDYPSPHGIAMYVQSYNNVVGSWYVKHPVNVIIHNNPPYNENITFDRLYIIDGGVIMSIYESNGDQMHR